ncbi:MAG: HEAT repeat domain-containing protein [Candidatus Wallbacteria bacterium]
MSYDNAKKEALIKSLYSTDNVIKHNAIMAIADYADESIMPHLEKLANDPDPAIRYFAKKIIKKIKDSSLKQEVKPAEEKIEEVLNLDHFKNALANSDSEVRLKVLKTLFFKPIPGVLPLLLEQLKIEKDYYVIATLVKLAGKFGGDEQIEVIASFLSHEDMRIRANAIEGLEFIGTDKIIPYLVKYTNDLDNRIKANAVKALAKFSSSEMLKNLAIMIKSEQVWMRDSAIFALGQINNEAAVQILNEALYDKEKTISNHAMQALIKIALPSALGFVDKYREKMKSIKPSSVKTVLTSSLKDKNAARDVSESDEIKERKPDAVIKKQEEIKPEPVSKIVEKEVVNTPPGVLKNDEKPAEPEIKTIDKQANETAGKPPVDELAIDLNSPVDTAAFDKLKSSVKKEGDLIFIIKDEDSVMGSSFKINLDDDFKSYANEIKYVALQTATASGVSKKIGSLSEKKSANIDLADNSDVMPPARNVKSENAQRLKDYEKQSLLDSLNKGPKDKHDPKLTNKPKK